MPMGWLFEGGETIQGSIHVSGSYAKAHWGETTQMHSKFYTLMYN